MAGPRRSGSKGKADTRKYVLDTPTWPDACPTKHTEKIMSIITGNTHLNWAVHEGEANGFTPILFWRTPPLHPDEKNDDPSEVLARHLPPQAHAFVFGDVTMSATKGNAAAIAAMRRVPAISVFVISTNEANENAVGFLFQDVPTRIFKLRTSDFFDDSAEAYESMGVDRAATLRGATTMHPLPSLVIDAGTALTYTGMDRYGKIIGGGICPGINSRFRSLHDYCGALPRIEFEEYKTFVEQMKNADEVAVSVFSKSTKEQIMVNVFTEIAFKCRSAIQHFLKLVGEGELEEEETEPQNEVATSQKEITTSAKPSTTQNGALENSATKPTLKDPPPTDSVAGTGTSGDVAVAASEVPADAATAPSSEPTPMETEPTESPAKSTSTTLNPASVQPINPLGDNGKESVAENPPAENGNAKAPPPPEPTSVVEKVHKSTKMPSVTITGGDAAFLEMLLNLKNLSPGPLSGIPELPDPNKFEIRSVKHLIHYGISAVLSEKFKLYNIEDPDQALRHKLVGLRVAKKFDEPDRDGDPVFRGSVLFIKSEDTKDKRKVSPLETDLFNIRYDDGDTEDMTLVQLYAALVFYQDVGEKPIIFKVASQEDLNRKKNEASEVSKALVEASPLVSQAKDKMEKEKAQKEAEAQAAKEAKAAKRSSSSVSSTATPNPKKAKKGSSVSSAPTSPKISKEDFVGKRVAKLFPMEDDKGNPIKVVFFGKIDKIVEDSDNSLWHVLYDDDDEEEFDEKDVKRGLRLYEKEKAADKNAN